MAAWLTAAAVRFDGAVSVTIPNNEEQYSVVFASSHSSFTVDKLVSINNSTGGLMGELWVT